MNNWLIFESNYTAPNTKPIKTKYISLEMNEADLKNRFIKIRQMIENGIKKDDSDDSDDDDIKQITMRC
jgi:replicative DNA helicase